MRKFKLLHDTYDGMKAGMVFEEVKHDNDHDSYGYVGTDNYIDKSNVENNPQFFQEITEEVNEWQFGDLHWYVTTTGYILSDRWIGSEEDNDCLRMGHIFKTKKAAEMHKLRLESMAKRTTLNKRDTYYKYSFTTQDIIRSTWGGSSDYDFTNYFIGNAHKTAEDALEWGEKYGLAWSCLLTKNDE